MLATRSSPWPPGEPRGVPRFDHGSTIYPIMVETAISLGWADKRLVSLE